MKLINDLALWDQEIVGLLPSRHHPLSGSFEISDLLVDLHQQILQRHTRTRTKQNSAKQVCLQHHQQQKHSMNHLQHFRHFRTDHFVGKQQQSRSKCLTPPSAANFSKLTKQISFLESQRPTCILHEARPKRLQSDKFHSGSGLQIDSGRSDLVTHSSVRLLCASICLISAVMRCGFV